MSSQSLGELPSELILLVASFLEAPALNSLLQCCHRFRYLLHARLYLLARRYRGVPEAGTPLIWAVRKGRMEMVVDLLKDDEWPSDYEEGTSALHEAASSDNTDAIRLLVHSGADLLAENQHKESPLGVAVSKANFEASRLLIQVYFDFLPRPTFRARWHDVLHRAIKAHCEPICAVLLQHANELLDEPEVVLTNVLHLVAASEGQCDIIRLLCDHGADLLLQPMPKGLSLLHTFAQAGRCDAIKLGISYGIDPGTRCVKGDEPIHVAARRGHTKAIQTLIDGGASIEARSADGQTPIMKATHAKDRDAVRFLLNAGADVLARDDHGFNAVDHALAGDEVCAETIEVLLQNGADPVPPPDTIRMTAMHWAAREGLVDVIRFLHDAGAPVNCVDQKGMSPLHFAAREGHLEALKTLVHLGASLTSLNQHSLTPLHAAAREGNVEAVETLVHLGAPLDGVNGHNPLDTATSEGHPAVVEKLLQLGAGHSAPNRWGWTPLHYANKISVAELLLSAGADVQALNDAGDTPLDYAARVGREELCTLFIRHHRQQAPDNATGQDGLTLLGRSVHNDKAIAVRALLEEGFDPNAYCQGSTALHIAVLAQSKEMADLLMEFAANPYALDLYGRSPFDYALGVPEIVEAMTSSKEYRPTDPIQRKKRLRQTIVEVGSQYLSGIAMSLCALCIMAKALNYLRNATAALMLYAHDGYDAEDHKGWLCGDCGKLPLDGRFVCCGCANELCLKCKEEMDAERENSHHVHVQIGPAEPVRLPEEERIGREEAWKLYIRNIVGQYRSLR